jgi:hypothetical protein
MRFLWTRARRQREERRPPAGTVGRTRRRPCGRRRAKEEEALTRYRRSRVDGQRGRRGRPPAWSRRTTTRAPARTRVRRAPT